MDRHVYLGAQLQKYFESLYHIFVCLHNSTVLYHLQEIT